MGAFLPMLRADRWWQVEGTGVDAPVADLP